MRIELSKADVNAIIVRLTLHLDDLTDGLDYSEQWYSDDYTRYRTGTSHLNLTNPDKPEVWRKSIDKYARLLAKLERATKVSV